MDGIISPDYAVFLALHREDSRYLNFLFRCQLLPGVYRSISNGIRPDQWRLEPDRFKELIIPVPPASEQPEIAEHIEGEVDRIDKLALEADVAITLLQERRTALISAAVTGKIDVRAAIAEPESQAA
jgi:type I restriction enzyme S subunit